MRRRHVLAAVLAVCLLQPAAAQQSDRNRLAEDVLRLANEQRALNGVQPLALDSRLSAAAQAHAEDMAKRDYLDHRAPDGRSFEDRVVAAGYPWRAIAENLAGGPSTPASVVNGWMTSPDHRDNMLGADYVHAGIGYARPEPDGRQPRYRHYWVIVFGAPSR